MTEKQIAVLKLLAQEGGKAAHYFVTQLCGLYADPDDTLYNLQKDGYITSVTVRRSSTYSITDKGRDAIQPTDEPAAVDMGGDFEGFVEAVNAPEPLFEDESDHATPQALIASLRNATTSWLTLPMKTVDGIEVRAEITRSTVGGYLVCVGALCTKTDSFVAAIDAGNDLVRAEVERLNKRDTPRVKQLRARIASQERELIDLRFELSQLLEGEE